MRLLIANDHALLRDSLRSLLETRGIEVVGEAGNGREALELARRLRPDVVLMDLPLDEHDGLEAMCRIHAEVSETKVVVLTDSNKDSDLFEALKAGADGYLLKDLPTDRFFALLEGVMRGEPALPPGLARRLLQEFVQPRLAARKSDDPDALTDREAEVLELMVEGITSNRDLAQRLRISENTIKFHVRNILDKLHLHNRAQVVGYALRHGMIPS